MDSDLFVVVVIDSMVRPNVRAYGPLRDVEAHALAAELNSAAGNTGPGTAAAVPVLSREALVREEG